MLKGLKKEINLIKTCAVFTTVCFVMSTMGANLYAIPMGENANKKYEDVFNKASSISSEYGKITSSKDAKSDITVINIQDLHCHPQTQRNISKIIGQIASKYNLKKIYVEGGYGDIDVSWLNAIKDEKIKKQVIEKLMDEGILTGSEYYKLTNNNDSVELKGIDEEKLHQENIKRLSWIIENQNKYKDVLSKIDKEIEILEKIHVNDRNARFNKIIEEYSLNKIDSKKFYKYLSKYVKDINNNPEKYNNITAIRLEDYPNISKFMTLRKVSKNINMKETTLQMQVVINELKNRLPYSVYTKLLNETDNFSNGQKVIELILLLCEKEKIDLTKYEALNTFLESNYITRNINPVDLVQEERDLIREIRKALSYNNEEYEITFVSDFSRLFHDYLEYKLTDADWKYFKKVYTQFRELYSKYATADRIAIIEQDFDEINKYYEINDQRNNIFVENLLKDEQVNTIDSKDLRQEEEILKDSREVIIAVTGGFHSSELEEILQAKDVNTIVVTPKIYENIKQANKRYIDIIEEQSRLKTQALAYTIASCTPDINKQKLLLSIVKDIVGDNSENLEKVLGKKVDLSILEEKGIDVNSKKEIKDIIETGIQQFLQEIPQVGLKWLFLPNIDKIFLSIAEELVKHGIYFSKGMIFDIENSNLNGKDLQGVPAEIYSRMMPSLQKALLKVAEKKEEDQTLEEFNQDIQDLYEDTGTTETLDIYLEDINDNPQLFIDLLRDSITNKKLMILHIFRAPINIDELDREIQIELYKKIREMFFKIYTEQPLYNFISQPENKDFIRYDIHFFLLEILENSFMHGNKGLDKPIYLYMDLNEQNEINTLKIYNKNSEEDDNFLMRLTRMKRALLGGRHKSNVLMKQNPYRTFEIDDNCRGKFYKVSSDIKPFFDEQVATWLMEKHEFISYFSIFAPFKNKNNFLFLLHETAHIWEEMVFRTLPVTLAVLPITAFLPVPAILALFTIFQLLFIKAHKGNFKEQIKQKFLPTTILSAPYVLALLFVPCIPAIILSTIVGIGIHKYLNLAFNNQLNIFDESNLSDSTLVDYKIDLEHTISLKNDDDREKVKSVLNGRKISKQESEILVGLFFNDAEQYKYFVEVLQQTKIRFKENREIIVETFVEKMDISNKEHIAIIKELLEITSLNLNFILPRLLIKMNLKDDENISLLKYFISQNKYNVSLSKAIIEKVDIIDEAQFSLLYDLQTVNNDAISEIMKKIDIKNNIHLKLLLKLILKADYTLSFREIFSKIISEIDFSDKEVLKILSQFLLEDNHSLDDENINLIMQKINFSFDTHVKLLSLIAQKLNKNIDLIFNFLLDNNVNLNDKKYNELFKIIIDKILSKYNSYRNAQQYLQSNILRLPANTVQGKRAFSLLIDLLHSNLIAHQNKYLRIVNGYIILRANENGSDHVFNSIDDFAKQLAIQKNLFDLELKSKFDALVKDIDFFRKMEVNTSRRVYTGKGKVVESITANVTLEEFCQEKGFSLIEQTPNVYFDSNRYSFTNILSLFSKRVLTLKPKKHNPTYFMTRNKIDVNRLNSVISRFNAYMKLLDENAYILNEFAELDDFSFQFYDVVNHIKLMIDYLEQITDKNISVFRKALENILEEIENQNTNLTKQKELIEYSSTSGLFDNITTINTLVNRIHQYANFSFLTKIMTTTDDYEKAGYNTLVSKNANLISVYNLSSNELNPQIKKFLLELAENPDFSTDTKSPIFIKDNIFLWVASLGAHSVRILIDFNEDSKSVLIDFQETAIDDGSTIRIKMLDEILSNIGFKVKKTLRSFDNAVLPVGIVATLDKDTGLTSNMDFNNLAKQAVVLFNNAASLNNLIHTKFQIRHNINVAKQAIMDVYSIHYALSIIRDNFVRTVVNNRISLNKILRTLEMPLIPIKEKGFWTFLKIGFFRVGFIRTLGQNTIDKYINIPVEESFATGYLKINEQGFLERNQKYNPILSITEKLNTIILETPGNVQEIEMLNNGAILSQVPEQNLNLKTSGQIGGYILKTGYMKLVDGTIGGDTKGEFLNVRMLVDKNGIIRYSESELVGLPERMQNKTGRITLHPNQLQQILSREGYDITEQEIFTDDEIITYRERLQEVLLNNQMPIAYGTLLSKPIEKKCVVGAINRENFNTIFMDEYATPENVSIAAQHEISLFNAGAYTSHAGIVLREYHKTAMVVNSSQITKQGMRIKFYQPKKNSVTIGTIEVQETEEKEIYLQDKDIVVVDLVNNRLILYPYSVFKNTLLNLQKYINEQDEEKIKDFLEKYKNNKLIDKIIEYIHYQAGDNEWLQKFLPNFVVNDDTDDISKKRVPRVINKINLRINNYLPHKNINGVYRFGEEDSLDKTKVGTKSANQSKLYLNVEQMKNDIGVENVAVPNGIAIDYTILEDLLRDTNYNKLYGKLKELYDELKKLQDDINEEIIPAEKSFQIELSLKQQIKDLNQQIIELISNIDDIEIKNYIDRNYLKIFKRSKVIVRSSGLNEDGEDFSAAGIAESIGNVEYGDISKAVKDVFSSFFSNKAFEYMSKSGKLITPSILIEDWIEADKSGVMMSENRDGNGIVQVINGQGEKIVSGKINPYSFVIDINTGKKIDGNYTNKKTITEETLKKLVKIMYWLEQVEGVPVDIEFLIKDDIIYIVQVRPITALTYYTEDLYEEGDYIDDDEIEYIAEYDEDDVTEKEKEISIDSNDYDSDLTENKTDRTKRKKRISKSKNKKSSQANNIKKNYKNKSKKEKKSETKKKEKTQTTTSFEDDSDIRQPYGLQERDINRNLKKLAQSKDSLDKTYELSQEETKKVLLSFGLTRQQVEKINFDEGLPDYVVALLKSRNSQILGTTIDPEKSLIETLKEHPILFSLVIQTFTRIYASDLNTNSTFGELLDFIDMRYLEKLSEATSMDLRGFFGEYYTANTLIAGFIPDKRAGPIIIRPQLADTNNARGYDIYNPVNDNLIQIKIGGSGLVHKHFRKYWKLKLNKTGKGLLAIPVITTKNVKANSFPTDGRVQGLDITTETATKFAHDIVSLLYGITYKKNIPAIRDIRLKDLIDSFKGFPNERSITLDTLIDILTKNQVKSINREKKYLKKKEESVIEFLQGKVDVDSFANQDIVVNMDSQKIHVLSINEEKIFVNEENKREIKEKDFPLYGIDEIEYDEDGYISSVIFKKGVSLSVLTIDGAPKEKRNNIDFSEQEMKSLNLDSKTEGYIDIFLDGDIDEICHLIKKAATENKLIVIHFFKDGFKTSDLTPSQLLDMYKKILKLISSRFKISDIFPNSLEFSEYTDYGLDFFFEEILKNALLRGNLGKIEEPIALNIKLDKNNAVQTFSVYNKTNISNVNLDETVGILAKSAHLMLIGDRKSTEIMTHNPVRKYTFDEKYSIGENSFRKAKVSLRDVVDMEMYNLEQEYKNKKRNKANSNITLQASTTIKKLYEKGLEKYRKKILKQPGRIGEDLSSDDMEEIEDLAQNYKHTISGILYGVFKIEFFSFFSKDFTDNHINMPIFAKIGVNVIRAMSIGIGLSIAIFSLSVLPLGSFVLNFFISVFFGTAVMYTSAAILHSLWNILVVAMNKYHLLLQQNIIGRIRGFFKEKQQSQKTKTEKYQREQNSFSQEETELFNKDTDTVGSVTIYLDSTDFAEQLEQAVRENKLVILYLSEKQKYTSGLTEQELFKIYNELDLDIYNKFFNLRNKAFFKSNLEENNATRRFGCAFYLNEIIKNAFVHGNKGMLEMPIALSIKMKDGEMDEISVYNRNLDDEAFNYESREEIIKQAGLSGRHLGKKYMKANPIRTYSEEPDFDDGHFYKVVSKFNKSVTKEEIKSFQKELLYSSVFSILPENMGLVNIMLQEGFNLSYIALDIAIREFKASLQPNFIYTHQSYKGKKGGTIVRYLMNKYQITSEDSLFNKIIKSFILLVINTESIVKHIVIDYKFIKSSGITQAIKMFGDTTYMDEFGEIHIPPVLIVNDLENIRKNYKLKSTGIKVNGKSIFQIELNGISNGILIYGAQGMKQGEIIRVLNETNEIKEKIENIIEARGFNNITVDIEGVMFEQTTDVLRFEKGLTIINEQELKNKKLEYINRYINSSVEIKRSVGVMCSQKALISLEKIDNLETLKKALTEGRARKIITLEQYEQLLVNKKISVEDILQLRENGIEIYIYTNKIKEEFKNMGITGQIMRDTETNSVFIYDYYSEEKTEIEEIGNEETLTSIENKLINSKKLILIDIKLLAKKFQNINILDAYSGLNTLIGNIKIKTGIGELNKEDIASLGYNLDFNIIPELSLSKQSLSEYTKEEIERMLQKALINIPENSEIGIILKAIRKNKTLNEDVFTEIIKERILAKTALRQNDKEYGLKDKKLEILLGKMLLKQVYSKNKTQITTKYVDDEGYMIEVTGKENDFMKKIMQDTIKAMNGDEVAINTIIDIILVYGDSYKNRQIPRFLDKNDARNYRAMLVAA